MKKQQKNAVVVSVLMAVNALLYPMTSRATLPVVVNPSFEADGNVAYGAVTGWTQIRPAPPADYRSGATATLDSAAAPDGTHMGYIQIYSGFSPSSTTASFSQAIAGFEIGQQYYVTYFENSSAARAAHPPTLQVLMDGNTIVAAHVVTPVNSFQFMTSSLFTATATTETLEFRVSYTGPGTDSMLFLDMVQIVGVPEPSTLMLLGIGGLLVFRHRQSYGGQGR